MDLSVYNSTYDQLISSLPATDARILELGCGPGNITRYLLKQSPGYQILDTDIAPNMVALARQNNPTARFEVMDVRDVGALNERFDAIVAGFCIPYLTPDECDHLITDCATLLTTGGILYLSFVEGDPAESGFKSSNMGRVFFNYHRLVEIEAFLQRAGFQQIEISLVDFIRSETVSEQHTIVLVRRG